MDNETTQRWNKITDNYNAFRPHPPERLINTLLRLSQKSNPELIVDLGCGPGNSTRAWQNSAAKIIGIDPSKEMISTAIGLTESNNIS